MTKRLGLASRTRASDSVRKRQNEISFWARLAHARER